MLEGELRGRNHRHRVFARDNGSGDNGGTETAYRQIAAVLVEQGLPFHSAYRPVPHFPAPMRDAVASYLRNHPELLRLMEADVDEPTGMVPDLGERALDEIASRAPEPGDIPEIGTDEATGTAISGIDFLAREQRNHSLAWAGELFVIQYELACARPGPVSTRTPSSMYPRNRVRAAASTSIPTMPTAATATSRSRPRAIAAKPRFS
jgi:hypothetical protein